MPQSCHVDLSKCGHNQPNSLEYIQWPEIVHSIFRMLTSHAKCLCLVADYSSQYHKQSASPRSAQLSCRYYSPWCIYRVLPMPCTWVPNIPGGHQRKYQAVGAYTAVMMKKGNSLRSCFRCNPYLAFPRLCLARMPTGCPPQTCRHPWVPTAARSGRLCLAECNPPLSN